MIEPPTKAAMVAVDLAGKLQSPLVGGLTWGGCRILSMILRTNTCHQAKQFPMQALGLACAGKCGICDRDESTADLFYDGDGLMQRVHHNTCPAVAATINDLFS